jgi:outer membrane protein assembly factor BamD
MRFRPMTLSLLTMALAVGLLSSALGQNKPQNDLAPVQRLDVMRSRLEAMKRSLTSAIAGIPQKAQEKNAKPDAEDPRTRLQGLDKEVSSLLSEVNDLHSKQDRSERYDATKLDTLEAAVIEVDGRVQTGLQATAGARKNSATADASSGSKSKKKGGFHLWPFGGSSENAKYEELTSTVAPGRDRVLFEEAAKEVRHGNHDTGRLLFTTIITTYPDSPFLPLAKLAIADSFYLEGGTSSLIQAAASYQDWLTFFPTDPLADAAMLKVAEAEMRQMGLSDRDVSHARKAEQRLKALLQQYPQTTLRDTVQSHMRQVQENLGMHNKLVGDFYFDRFRNNKTGLRGAQSRYKEIFDKYKGFSYMDEILFKLATTYQVEEEPDEAAKYYQQLVRDYPNSDYLDKAKEQLNIIGAPIPEPDPERKSMAPAEHPGFMGNLMQQVAGRADVTVGKDGILISHDRKDGEDLIDQALKYNGQLPANTNTTPIAPVQRRDNSKQKPTDTANNPGSSGGNQKP